MKFIIGAGLTGLIAAHAWPRAALLERAPGPAPAHAALLRFRTDTVAALTGIEFRPVKVRKGIWTGGKFVEPSIREANMYAQKCMGRLDSGERSIWNLAPADRFIAPEDFYERLIENVGSRIRFGMDATAQPESILGSPVVSTIPLAFMAQVADIKHTLGLRRSPISVTRFRLPNTDLHQTIYFPSNKHNCYRASITGSLLICEHAGVPASPYLEDIWQAFGLRSDAVDELPPVNQQYGKIAPEPDDGQRRKLLFDITEKLGVYSLGRFATWRNVLLDDVVHDITVIKRMMRGNSYERRLAT
jgi:hypothetical protein